MHGLFCPPEADAARCDDIETTVADLRTKGVEFTSDIADRGFGLVTTFELPGGVPVLLHEPRHAQP